MRFLLSTLSLISITAVGFSLSARAQDVVPTSYEVEIPQSRIEYAPAREAKAVGVEQLEFGASSWMPSGLSLPGRVTSAQAFTRSGLPSLYFNYLKSSSLRIGNLDGIGLKAGLNWLALDRASNEGSQSVQLLSVRLGTELSSRALQTRIGSPYLGLALLPSFALTDRSVFDDGSVYFGVPIEATLGLRTQLSTLGIAWPGSEFDLGLVGTAGTVNHSSLAALGVQGGIRVAL